MQGLTLIELAHDPTSIRRGGRRALQPGDPRVQLAYTMYVDHRWAIDELCATLGISRATCYRYVALARRAVPEG